MCLAVNHMMSIFACDRCLNVTRTCDVTTSHKKRNCFRTAWLDIPQLLNQICVVLSVFLHICMQKCFR